MRRVGKAIMLQGTGSHVGKSLLTTAFCRILAQDGYRVAPFKAQNMSLNSAVTSDGGEIGRAQFEQALAAGREPRVEMNPILLKPKADLISQVIVLGRPRGDMSWTAYRQEARSEMFAVVRRSLAKLLAEADVVVLEGAGSPAEVNLMDRDIANMAAAELADAPVLLVGDIDRGGVFASLLGTLEILPEDRRRRVAGFLINKFRGDVRLLGPGLAWLERRTGRPTLGVIPFLPGPGIDEEDSVALDDPNRSVSEDRLDIVVVRFPRISNFTDVDPLARQPDVRVRFVRSAVELRAGPCPEPDAVILPGTKNTIEDLRMLYRTGLARAVLELARRGVPTVGLCGGFQMLGRVLEDPDRIESDREPPPPLGLLPVATVFESEKRTVQAQGRWLASATLVPWGTGLEHEYLSGYEVHMGRTRWLACGEPLLSLRPALGSKGWPPVLDGAAADEGQIWGTYLHGVFENEALTRRWLNYLRRRRGWLPLAGPTHGRDAARAQAFDRLADHVRRHVDMAAFYQLLGLPHRPAGRS